jgi:hypothetical protein
VASGPSLTREDVEYAGSLAPLVVVNDAVRLAPSAPVFYSSDQYWLKNHDGLPGFKGEKWAVRPGRHDWHPFGKYPEVLVLANTGTDGLETDPGGLRTGRNSGYAAINLAVHFGASRIVLLGYDMGVGPSGEAHFTGDKKTWSHYHLFRTAFKSLVAPLAALGIQVVNSSRRTALTAFPRLDLREAMA